MSSLIHSTRLFPKGKGADAYRVTGIASRCDWVVLTDTAAPQSALLRQGGPEEPRHIFLSMRAPFVALRVFAREILPNLTSPFILISGSEDVTLPLQTDRRWREFTAEEHALIKHINDSPVVLRWFVENLSAGATGKMSSLPLGMVYPEGSAEELTEMPAVPPLADRPLRVLCAHRVREGVQWDIRRKVTRLGEGAWSGWTTVLKEDVPEDRFLREVEAHSFVLCVEGGGVDPSPKAWQTLLHGAIPIIRSSLRDSYSHLPVVFLDDWQADRIDLNALSAWKAMLVERMDSPPAREDLRQRLMMEYWWSWIVSQ